MRKIAWVVASLIVVTLLSFIAGCGGGGGSKPPEFREVAVARFVDSKEQPQPAVRVNWTAGTESGSGNSGDDGVLRFRTKNQGTFDVTLTSPENPELFAPVVINVPAGAVTPTRVVVTPTEVVTRSLEGETSVVWSPQLRSIKLQIIETRSKSRQVISPDLAEDPICQRAETDRISEGIGLRYFGVSDDYLVFRVLRPGITKVIVKLRSDPDSPIEGQVTIRDEEDPFVTIFKPSEGTVKGEVVLEATFRDDDRVAFVAISIDGVEVARASGTSVSYSWDTTQASEGDHAFQAKAKDRWGNTGSSSTVSVTVDNVADPDVWRQGLGGPSSATIEKVADYHLKVKYSDGIERGLSGNFRVFGISPKDMPPNFPGIQWVTGRSTSGLVRYDQNSIFVGQDEFIGEPVLKAADLDAQGSLWAVTESELQCFIPNGSGTPMRQVYSLPTGVTFPYTIFVERKINAIFISCPQGIIWLDVNKNNRTTSIFRQWPNHGWEYDEVVVDSDAGVLIGASWNHGLTAFKLNDTTVLSDYPQLVSSAGKLTILPDPIRCLVYGEGNNGLTAMAYNGNVLTTLQITIGGISGRHSIGKDNNEIRVLNYANDGFLQISEFRFSM